MNEHKLSCKEVLVDPSGHPVMLRGGNWLERFILSKRAGWSENRAHDLVFS